MLVFDAMDPDGFGYDDYGNWDQERLGFLDFLLTTIDMFLSYLTN